MFVFGGVLMMFLTIALCWCIVFDCTGSLAVVPGCSVPTARLTEESSNTLVREIRNSAPMSSPQRKFLQPTRNLPGKMPA